MAKFERHFAGVKAEPQTFPRAPAQQLADTGQVLGAQALAELGGGLTDVSAILFKWHEREGNSEYDSLRGLYASRMGEEERTSYADSTALEAGKKKLEADLAKLPSKNSDDPLLNKEYKNKSGLKKYKAFLELNKANREKIMAEKEIRMIAQQNQVALFNNLSNVAKITDQAEAIAEVDLLVQGGLDDGTIKTAAQAINMRDKATENWLRADTWRRATVIKRPDGEVDWSAAVDWFNQAENIKNIPESIIEDLAGTARSMAATQERGDATALKEKQDNTGRQMLIDLWDENLTEAKIAEAVSPDKKWITTEQAKYLRTALLSKKPRKTDLIKYAEVKDAILDVGLGRKTRQEALDILYKNITQLSDDDAKSSLNAVYAATLKDDNYWISESRSYMEEQIREKDPLTGMFTDDAAEIALAAQSKLILDKTIEDAEAEDKPLSGRDILIKAHELAIPLRQRAAELRKKKAIPEVIGEGLGEAPFITEADLDRAEEQARKNLGEAATKQEIKTEMLRLLGE